MQDVDRPADVQSLAEPARARGARVKMETCRRAARSELFDGIVGSRGRRRDIRQRSAVGSSEPESAVGQAFQLESLLVDGAVVPATEHREVGEGRGAAVCPVADVMTLTEG